MSDPKRWRRFLGLHALTWIVLILVVGILIWECLGTRKWYVSDYVVSGDSYEPVLSVCLAGWPWSCQGFSNRYIDPKEPVPTSSWPIQTPYILWDRLATDIIFVLLTLSSVIILCEWFVRWREEPRFSAVQIHLSTALMLSVTAGIILMLNLAFPGQWRDGYLHGFNQGYGFPQAFYVRHPNYMSALWDTNAMAGDVGLAVYALIHTTFGFEYLIRRREIRKP